MLLETVRDTTSFLDDRPRHGVLTCFTCPLGQPHVQLSRGHIKALLRRDRDPANVRVAEAPEHANGHEEHLLLGEVVRVAEAALTLLSPRPQIAQSLLQAQGISSCCHFDSRE